MLMGRIEISSGAQGLWDASPAVNIGVAFTPSETVVVSSFLV